MTRPKKRREAPAMHWLRVDGKTFCGRPQLAGFNPKRDCKNCEAIRTNPALKVVIIAARKRKGRK